MQKVSSLLLLSAVWLSAVTFGQANKVKAQLGSGEKLFDYQSITLDNGLNVITLEDFSTPIVAVQVWYAVGSKNERPDRQGYAHMFEHMMFKGTDHVSESDFFNLLRKVGGTNNAYTSFDQTVYYETLPSDQLGLALWLEAERMGFLKIDQPAFDTERQVVEEELRMRENQPYGNAFKKMAAVIFKDQPYQWTPIGNLATLRATSVPDLRQFWISYYVPNNATLIIVGAVEHAKAQALARQYFGWIPTGPQPPKVSVNEAPLTDLKTIVIDDENAPAGQVTLAWRTVPTGTRQETALDLLSQILGTGYSSRVYRELVAKTQIAVEAGTDTYNLQQDGLFLAQATLPPESNDYDALIAALKAQVEKVQKEGVSEAELEKARNQLLKQVVTTNLEIESKASLLGTAAVTMGDVRKVNTLIDRIRSISSQEVQQAAMRYLDTGRTYQFIIKRSQGMAQASKDNEAAPITAKPELQAPPPGRPGLKRPDWWPSKPPIAQTGTKGFELKYKEEQLPNGLKIKVVSNHEVPFVSVTLGLTNGAWTETKPATAFLTLQMLTKGTAKHTEAQLADALEQYAISLSAMADMDTSSVGMNCLTEQADRGMALLSEVVQTPTFDSGEFAKLVNQQVTELQIQRQDPEYLAETAFNRIVFDGHPYGRPVKGTPQEMRQLSAEDLSRWWSVYARPEQATLIFAGDITRDKALEMARQYFGDWKSQTAPAEIRLADIPQQSPTKIYLVNRPGSAQAQIQAGELGITRHSQPDYFYSLIAGNYFGGSFHSRLNDTIRVKKGLSYGAFGGFQPMAMAGTFVISTFTKNSTTAETVGVIIDQVREFETVMPSDEEFSDARSYFLGSFARNRETPQDVARDLWMIESQRLGKDYFKKLFKTMNRMDKEDCLDLAKRTVNPQRLAIVVVGDAKQLEEDLAEVAPVERIDIPE
ncbi:MAG: insulinase family protein [Planctomycetaceae bacterium]|nr:insulinase family protein [Planctomycetaceae bacterium]